MTKRNKLKDVEKIPFDDQSPWGRHRGPAWARWLLTIGHAVPAVPGGHHVAKWFRHPVRRHLDKPMDMNIWGYKLRLMTRGNITESEWLFVPTFCEREERRWIDRSVNPGGVFVDIGANVGLYSFWIDRQTGGDARTIAIEPDPDIMQRLRYNLETNRVRSVTTIPAALGDTPGTAELHRSPKNRGGNTLLDRNDNTSIDTDDVTVRVMRLTHLCEELGLERIDTLKIDIEGFEDRVLTPFFRDAPESLRPRHVLIEHKHRHQWENDVIDAMGGLGYEIAESNGVNTLLRYPS